MLLAFHLANCKRSVTSGVFAEVFPKEKRRLFGRIIAQHHRLGFAPWIAD
jgi:hypothetical protein